MAKLSDWLIVVPARLKATRLPTKPLVDLGGKPLVVATAMNLKPLLDLGAELLIAADDPSIVAVCQDHGLPACLTRASHETGTDRCREAAQNSSRTYVLNVQVDEPFLATDDLIALAEHFPATQTDIGTLVYPSTDPEHGRNPNMVKAVMGKTQQALYFSRAPIPWDREHPHSGQGLHIHIGVYAYSQQSLERFCQLPQGELEQWEKLEQLRALEHGMTIYAHQATSHGFGIDTPEDLERARAKI